MKTVSVCFTSAVRLARQPATQTLSNIHSVLCLSFILTLITHLYQYRVFNDIYFEFFAEITSFHDITNDSKVAIKMAELYQNKNNVDLWVGGLAEDHEYGSELGPTFRT